MTSDILWTILRNNPEFFSVEFLRRTKRKDGSASCGDLRRMLCRTAATMSAYKKGVISTADRDDEDFRNGVLTVWSVDTYNKLLRDGEQPIDAACNSWRRVDVLSIIKCSKVDSTTLPVDVLSGIHTLTNIYRLSHMPPAF